MPKESTYDYSAGIKEGRRQIIKNLKKHYDKYEILSPQSYYLADVISIQLPKHTLIKYFREIKDG
jgi:hypothetical protein